MALDSTPDTLDELVTPLLRLDAAGAIVEANQAAGRWLGVGRRRLLGTPAAALERDTQALAQVRELAAHAESAREEERTRIAREVHDELGSLLVALKMDVNWVDKRLGERPSVLCRSVPRLSGWAA